MTRYPSPPTQHDGGQRPVDSHAGIEFRTARWEDTTEYRSYLRLFWDIYVGLDPYFTRRSDEFVENWMMSVRGRETDRNTFSGIALHDSAIVGVHVLRAHEVAGDLVAHIAGLWVHPSYRGIGIARRLKDEGEAWARRIGAQFLDTNVHADNARMLRINENAGFELYRINMRKDLR